MSRRLSISGLLLLFSCALLLAQEWSKEDTIWLRNVLEGKETLKINEDTKKAIEEGRLIAPSRMKNSDTDSGMKLIKDFDDVGTPDSTRMRMIDIYSMPPSVYALYVFYIDKMDSAYQAECLILTDEEREMLKALTPGGIITDFNRLLSMVFSAHYRRIAHNRKYATAYKNYYDEGGISRPVRISDRERKQLIQSVNNIRPSVKVNTGNKINGIDN